MSGMKPFFITGSNCKIKINGRTLAFATDLSYSVQVITQTPKILGMYEGSSVEPLGYSVNGSFTIIRYVKDVRVGTGSQVRNTAANDAGNGVGNWGSVWGSNTGGDILSRNGIGNDGRANEALDPSKFENSTTFDIEIYQKVPSISDNQGFDAVAGRAVESALDILSGGSGSSVSNAVGVAKIRNCRITQSDFQITKKGVAMQKFNFAALYVDEDSFVADFSGRGQHF